MVLTFVVAQATCLPHRSSLTLGHVKNIYRACKRTGYATIPKLKPSESDFKFSRAPRTFSAAVGIANTRLRPQLLATSQCWTGNRNLHGKRWISYSAKPRRSSIEDGNEHFTPTWSTRTVEVPVGGNGNVVLDIHTLPDQDSACSNDGTKGKDIFIYLPCGIDTVESITTGAFLHTLSRKITDTQAQLNKPSPVAITVNYRVSTGSAKRDSSDDYRYPTPVHDVSAAFDWIIDNQDELRGIQDRQELALDEPEPRLSIFGSHIGASLALMLALTQPNDIHAVSVQDPIVDWVGLDEIATSTSVSAPIPSSSRKRSRAQLEELKLRTHEAATYLINLRAALFRNPSAFFDPFASPMMFLRAPGRDTPLWRTARPELEGLDEDKVKLKELLKDDGGIEVSEAETRELVHERGYGPYDDDWHTAEPDWLSQEDRFNGVVESPHDNSMTDHDLDNSLAALSLDSKEDHLPAQQRLSDLSALPSMPSNDLPSHEDIYHHAELSARQAYTGLCRTPTPSNDIASPNTTSSDQSRTHQSPTNSHLPPRRRKVLRRWPPIGRPEDVELPYTLIFSTFPATPSASTVSPVDLSYVLLPQAKEMADVMRRACFWGREKSLGEERVVLKVIESATSGSGDGVEKDRDVLGRAVRWFSEVGQVEK